MGGPEPWEYYGTERSSSPHWRNEVTVESLYSLMTLDTLSSADLLQRTPLLVVHGTTDDYCSPDGARAVFERATGPTSIQWVETTNHIQLDDSVVHLQQALKPLVPFYRRELSPD